MMNPQLDTQSAGYAGGQFAAVGTIIATLVHYLPTVALILPCLWYAVLFYDRFVGSKRKISIHIDKDI